MIQITDLELNFLVYQYLEESGFTHSAFTFRSEAHGSDCPVDGNTVPPHSLIKCIMKGLEYLEMEANLSNTKPDDFLYIRPLDLITKDPDELKLIITERRKNQHKDEISTANAQSEDHTDREMVSAHQEKDARIKATINGIFGDGVPDDNVMILEEYSNEVNDDVMILEGNSNEADDNIMILEGDDDVTILEGHSNEVWACAWTPDGSLLASGSVDSTARIWNMEARNDGGRSGSTPNVLVLEHAMESETVTSVAWNGDGSLLATASDDGHARIWIPHNGELKSTLPKHEDSVSSVKWNKNGNYILTSSLDGTAKVWDVQTNDWKHRFESKSAGTVLETDWRNNESFAVSADKLINVCNIGTKSPVKTFRGHQSEVTSIKWDPTGSLLASSSNDTTIKIWSLEHDNCIHDFCRDHRMGVFTCRWSPTGQGTNNPNKQVLLASASYDSTVKMWDVEQGKLLCNFTGHRDAVYSIAFSPDGEYLASGSRDNSLHIWSVKTGKIVKSFDGDGSIFEVCWNKEGDKVAACTDRNTVFVLNFRF